MNEQLLYKLASLAAEVQSGFRRLDEKMNRFQSDLHESQLSTNDRINALDREFHEKILLEQNRVTQLEKDLRETKFEQQHNVNELRTWQHVAMAKVGVLTTVIALVWIILGPTLKSIIGISS